MIEGLTEEDFLQILIAAETIDGVVVGGQALNLWAQALLGPTEFDVMGPFTSKDIDFWGCREAARILAEMLSGRLLIPNDIFDSTPSSAAVEVVFNGETHHIDFLRVVCGLNTSGFLARAQELDVDGVRVALLHPLDVLKSRIAGMTVLRRSDVGAIRQLRASPVIVARYIEQKLEAGDIKEAQDLIRELLYEGTKRECDSLYHDHSFDVIPLISGLASRSEWDPRFAEHQIKKPAQKSIEARTRRRAEAVRKLRGAGS